MSFPRYPKYKDSGVEWLGEVPEHWEVRRFQRCVHVAEGQVDPEDPQFSGWPLIAPNHVEAGTGRLIEIESANDQGAESGKYVCKAGDVIYSKIRPALRKVCIAPTDCLCSADMYPLRPHSGLEHRFLFWLILSEQFSSLAELESQRVAMPKVNRESLKAVVLVLPPAKEQQSISRHLEAETAKIDALIAEQQRLIELLKEKRQAVISHAVTKGLNPDAPMKPSGIEWLGDIPTHWSVERGRFLYQQVELLPEPEDGVVTAFRDGQVTLRENRRIDGFTVAVQEVGYQRVRSGDLVIHGMDAFAGAIGVSESTGKCTPEYSVLEPRNRPLVNHFFAHILRLMARRSYVLVICPSVRERAPRFRFEAFKDVLLPVPPVEEQRKIVEMIDHATSVMQALTAEAERAIGLLQERRTALISAAVTGQIDVRGLA